jgi:hypothetical protein
LRLLTWSLPLENEKRPFAARVIQFDDVTATIRRVVRMDHDAPAEWALGPVCHDAVRVDPLGGDENVYGVGHG